MAPPFDKRRPGRVGSREIDELALQLCLDGGNQGRFNGDEDRHGLGVVLGLERASPRRSARGPQIHRR